jgi:hypothetical protein
MRLKHNPKKLLSTNDKPRLFNLCTNLLIGQLDFEKFNGEISMPRVTK